MDDRTVRVLAYLFAERTRVDGMNAANVAAVLRNEPQLYDEQAYRDRASAMDDIARSLG